MVGNTLSVTHTHWRLTGSDYLTVALSLALGTDTVCVMRSFRRSVVRSVYTKIFVFFRLVWNRLNAIAEWYGVVVVVARNTQHARGIFLTGLCICRAPSQLRRHDRCGWIPSVSSSVAVSRFQTSLQCAEWKFICVECLSCVFFISFHLRRIHRPIIVVTVVAVAIVVADVVVLLVVAAVIFCVSPFYYFSLHRRVSVLSVLFRMSSLQISAVKIIRLVYSFFT